MGRPEGSSVRRLALARLISNLGDRSRRYPGRVRDLSTDPLCALALGPVFADLRGSTAWCPIFGGLADRHDPRRIMITSR